MQPRIRFQAWQLCCCTAQVTIGIGQLSWAEQCFRLAIALEPNHGEALNNLGVLESRKGQLQQVRKAISTCQRGYCWQVWKSSCCWLRKALSLCCHGGPLKPECCWCLAGVQAAARFKSGMHGCGHVFELHYNAALLAHRQGDLQEALSQVRGEHITNMVGSAAVQPWPWSAATQSVDSILQTCILWKKLP